MNSLFPSATAKLDLSEEESGGSKEKEDQSWLNNPSYAPPPTSDSEDLSSSSDNSYSPKPKKRKGISSQLSSARVPPHQVCEKAEFELNSKPDVENLRYNSIYSGDVAIYKRYFNCMGLRTSQQLKWDDGRNKMNKKRKKKLLAQKVRYFRGNLSCISSEVAIPRKLQHTGIGLLSDFISINTTGFPSKVDAEDNYLTAEQHMSQLTGNYNRSLLEDPRNVQLWLEFLAFQDQLLEWGHLPGEVNDHTSRKKLALVERKLSIYERALEHNPMSEDLLIGFMTLAQEQWSADNVLKKWKDVVFRQPNRPRLWLCYIRFCQTTFSSFGTNLLISVYSKCLTTLSAIMEGTLKSHLPLPDTSTQMLTIFSLYCSFLKQVGFTERAVASYQALIEFNLCLPSDVDQEGVLLPSQKEFMEPFWDSGTPRFGEKGAMGWSNWTRMNKTKSSDAQTLGLLPLSTKKEEKEERVLGSDEDVVSGLPIPEAWLKLEDHRMSHNCLSWQPDVIAGETMDDCSDPDRIVTFDDVSKTLFRLPDPDSKLNLVMSFLCFLGAPLCSLSGREVLSGMEAMEDISPATSSLLNPGDERLGVESFPNGIGVSSTFTHTSSSLMDLATSLSSQTLSATIPQLLVRSASVCDFISQVCNQAMSLLCSTQQQTKLAQVWLSHLHCQLLCKSQSVDSQAHSQRMKAKIRFVEKLCKELLRLDAHRENLFLWNSYALFQHSVGNFKEVKKLYQSILAQGPTTHPTICRCLCECVMGLRPIIHKGEVQRDHQLALHALACLTKAKKTPTCSLLVSPSELLKARSYFISSSSDSAVVYSADMALCHCYFEFLTRGLKEACGVLEKWKQQFATQEKNSRELKIVYLKQLQLLEHFAFSHSLPPSKHRDFLSQALQVFPDSCDFLAAFIRHERQSFISGCMRRYFDRQCDKTISPVTWLYAVLAELDRFARVTGRQGSGGVQESSVGTVHRIMSMLSRATASRAGRHCPLLWRLYMAVQNCVDPAQVMAVFYQGVHNCPWSKVLYMDAVKLVSEKLDKVVELLEEKELRICAPLEEGVAWVLKYFGVIEAQKNG